MQLPYHHDVRAHLPKSVFPAAVRMFGEQGITERNAGMARISMKPGEQMWFQVGSEYMIVQPLWVIRLGKPASHTHVLQTDFFEMRQGNIEYTESHGLHFNKHPLLPERLVMWGRDVSKNGGLMIMELALVDIINIGSENQRYVFEFSEEGFRPLDEFLSKSKGSKS